jgi:hypothetical protein
MSLIEEIFKQQALIEKVYPKGVQDIVKLQSTIYRNIPEAVYKMPRPITSSVSIDRYLKSFFEIERRNHFLAKSLSMVERRGRPQSLFFVDYNLDKVNNDDDNKGICVEESKRIKTIVTKIYRDHNELFKLEPRTFEELIAELLSNEGFKVELTQQTRDNGYDILAIQNFGTGHPPLKYLVECKRYKTSLKVGVDIVRSFKEVLDTEQANRGIIVTTSYFTRDALKKQRERPYLLDFRDKDCVLEWVNNYIASIVM